MNEDSMSGDLTKQLPKSDNTEIVLILQNIDARLRSLEQKVEERLHDTRPIWERVVADIARLEGEVREIKVSVRDIFFQMSAVSDTMRLIQGSHKDFDLRLRDLEAKQQKPSNSST